MKHKNRITLRRFRWLTPWQLEEHESWFTDMAAQGWHLFSMNKTFAYFEQLEPANFRFRCVVFSMKDENTEDRITAYKELGWSHAATTKFIQVFKASNDAAITEFHVDSTEQVQTLTSLQKRFLLIALILLAITAFQSIMISNMINTMGSSLLLKDSYLAPLVISIAYLYINLLFIQGLFHLRKLIQKLESGNPSKHTLNYKAILRKNKTAGLFIISLLCLWIVKESVGLVMNFIPSTADEYVPIVHLSNIENSVISDLNTQIFTPHTSLFVPEQYKVEETGVVLEQTWPNSNKNYTPSITSSVYKTINPVFAFTLSQSLMDKPGSLHKADLPYWGLENNSHGFDKLWTFSGDFECEFIALKDNNIYHVIYNGIIPTETVIDAAYQAVIRKE